MADPHAQRDPVEALAEKFIERLRRGEEVSVEEYTADHPELAAEIEELFPTIAPMERLKTPPGLRHPGPPSAAHVPERLGDFRILREIGRGGMGRP